VADWRDEEWDEEAPPAREPTGEGVRILGSDAGATPSFAAGDDSDTWSASSEGLARNAGDEPSGSMPLPHWTEPPTGEVPRILDEDTSDDLESWSALTGSTPRFRTDSGDWASGDFEAGELEHDDSTLVGALDEDPKPDPYAAPMSRRARREAREAEEAAAKQSKSRRTRRASTSGAAPAEAASAAAASSRTADLADAPVDAPAEAGAAPPGPGSLEGPPRPPADTGRHHGPPGADTPQRVVTGVIAAVVAVVCFLAGRVPTLILATAIIGIAAFEFYEALRRAGYHTATLIGLLGCVAIVPVAYDQLTDAFPMMIFLVVAFTMLWYLFEVMRVRPTINIALTLMVFVWVGCFGAFAGLLLSPKHGVGFILGVALCVIAYDVVGWFVGSTMGRTALMPRVSPNKTVEGLVGGMIACVIMGVLVVSFVGGWKQGGFSDGLLLGVVIAIVAPLGDLVESMIKRDLGIKDFGAILPGHGGIMDRFDAFVFALPAAYYVALHMLH
jgi:phosphatidate cytidylyltransferase